MEKESEDYSCHTIGIFLHSCFSLEGGGGGLHFSVFFVSPHLIPAGNSACIS